VERRGGVTRVFVVAEHPFARAGLRALLGDQAAIDVVGEASSLEEASPLVLETHADAVIAAHLDGSVRSGPASDGPPVVLLGGDDLAAADLAPLLRGPVRAILSADASAEELGAALQAVTQGMLVIEPRVAQMLAAAVPVPQSDVDDGSEEALTDREREVLQLVALGLPNKTIATRLSISEHTVKFHVGSILGKLDAGSRTEAVTRAARRGLLTL